MIDAPDHAAIDADQPIEVDIATLHPQLRCRIIKRKLHRLEGLVDASPPDFTIHIVGSSVYCINPAIEQCGNLDDIDSFLVLPQGIPYEDVFGKLASWVKLDSLPEPAHFQQLVTGEIGIIRASGSFEGIEVGFHIMTFDGFRKIVPPYGQGNYLGNLLPNKAKYTGKIFVESEVGGREHIDFPADYKFASENLILLREYFSRRLTDGRFTLGVLGDKFLIGRTIHESPGAEIKDRLVTAWRIFIRSSIHFAPQITNDDIIGGFLRSPRFSNEIIARLNADIDTERAKITALLSMES